MHGDAPHGTGRGADSVVDDASRVHGVRGLRGLRVADASIMPMIPSANFNASVLMIGEKAGEMAGAGRNGIGVLP